MPTITTIQMAIVRQAWTAHACTKRESAPGRAGPFGSGELIGRGPFEGGSGDLRYPCRERTKLCRAVRREGQRGLGQEWGKRARADRARRGAGRPRGGGDQGVTVTLITPSSWFENRE